MQQGDYLQLGTVAMLSPELADGIILAVLIALAGSFIRVWVLCAKLWDLHNVRGSDGRPIWYGQEKAIESLAEVLNKNEDVMNKQCRVLSAMANKIENLPMCLVTELLRAGIIKSVSSEVSQPSVPACDGSRGN